MSLSLEDMAVEPGTELLVEDSTNRNPAALLSNGILGTWWVAFAGSAIFVVTGHLLIKAGLNGLVPLPAGASAVARALHAVLATKVLLGLFTYLMGTVCWMRAVSEKEISFLYPLSSVNYVLVAAASSIFFHEVVSQRRAAGVLVIVLGMVLMNRKSSKEAA
ncbi:MAG TPA: hypothetical protein VG892_08090 [Terriglobales bacterium]|jgi:drug/metabolite transporter (DMT)-like permease|nr:hypothetical protein [Terriglobales bacterium]